MKGVRYDEYQITQTQFMQPQVQPQIVQQMHIIKVQETQVKEVEESKTQKNEEQISQFLLNFSEYDLPHRETLDCRYLTCEMLQTVQKKVEAKLSQFPKLKIEFTVKMNMVYKQFLSDKTYHYHFRILVYLGENNLEVADIKTKYWDLTLLGKTIKIDSKQMTKDYFKWIEWKKDVFEVGKIEYGGTS